MNCILMWCNIIMAATSAISAIAAVCVAHYSMTEDKRKRDIINKQKCDVILIPANEYDSVAPFTFTNIVSDKCLGDYFEESSFHGQYDLLHDGRFVYMANISKNTTISKALSKLTESGLFQGYYPTKQGCERMNKEVD